VSSPVAEKLSRVLEKIDRPGSFCVSGSAPVVLPGLEVKGLGPIGLPLTATQAKELKKHCEQGSSRYSPPAPGSPSRSASSNGCRWAS